MNYPVPAYLTPFILTGMVLVIVTLVLGLRRALRRAAWPEADLTKAGVAASRNDICESQIQRPKR